MRLTITKTAVKVFLSTLLLSFIALKSFSAIETYQFSNDTDRARYQQFIEEMRCPKCQNQNLANSDSPISADLRREIYEQIKAGRTDSEINDFMVSRYGDFIRYNPRVTSKTYALWLIPVLLVIAGVIVIVLVLRSRRTAIQSSSNQLSSSEQQELNSLLSAHTAETQSASVVQSVEESVPDETAVVDKAASKKTSPKKAATKTSSAKDAATKTSATKAAAPKKAPAAKKAVKEKTEVAKPKATKSSSAKTAEKKSATTATKKTTAAKTKTQLALNLGDEQAAAPKKAAAKTKSAAKPAAKTTAAKSTATKTATKKTKVTPT